MYSMENISTILNFRNEEPEIYECTGKRPSDELILEALDLVRKFTRCNNLEITLGIEGLETVIRFTWHIGEFGIIQYTLSEDYLKLWVIDNNSNVLVNYEELNHNEYMSVDFITKHYIDVISEVKQENK